MGLKDPRLIRRSFVFRPQFRYFFGSFFRGSQKLDGLIRPRLLDGLRGVLQISTIVHLDRMKDHIQDVYLLTSTCLLTLSSSVDSVLLSVHYKAVDKVLECWCVHSWRIVGANADSVMKLRHGDAVIERRFRTGLQRVIDHLNSKLKRLHIRRL